MVIVVPTIQLGPTVSRMSLRGHALTCPRTLGLSYRQSQNFAIVRSGEAKMMQENRIRQRQHGSPSKTTMETWRMEAGTGRRCRLARYSRIDYEQGWLTPFLLIIAAASSTANSQKYK